MGEASVNVVDGVEFVGPSGVDEAKCANERERKKMMDDGTERREAAENVG